MIRKPSPSPDGQLGRPKPGAIVSGLRMNSTPNQRMKRMKAAARTVLIFFSDIVLLLASLCELGELRGAWWSLVGLGVVRGLVRRRGRG
jgi:hypothetical protein